MAWELINKGGLNEEYVKALKDVIRINLLKNNFNY